MHIIISAAIALHHPPHPHHMFYHTGALSFAQRGRIPRATEVAASKMIIRTTMRVISSDC